MMERVTVPNSSDLYTALNLEPADLSGEQRFIHVIGSTVFVDTIVADNSWGRHIVGVVEGCT